MNDDEEKEGERGCKSQMVEKVKNKRNEKHTFSSAGFFGSIRSATLVSRCSLIITGNNATLPKTLNAEQQGAKVRYIFFDIYIFLTKNNGIRKIDTRGQCNG